jgi:DNA-binding LacI/PurR family transcriptional regulator
MAAMLRGGKSPTAVICSNDWTAIGALHAIDAAGLRVPADISVVGFDDSPAALAATPPLTTIAQPHVEKGRLATRRLLDAIEHPARAAEEPTRDILPTELVVRGSTAPA